MRIRLVLASALVCGACAVAARAQDELGVFVEESVDSAGPIEAPRLEIDGRTVFVRPFAEAFVDPDQRMNLEPKYYFALTEELPDVDRPGPLDRASRWLDYRSGREPDRHQQVVFLTGAEGVPPQLCVARVRGTISNVVVDKIISQRDLVPAEIDPTTVCLDTLDRPPLAQPGANLQGRVIALWKQINDRHAVDFYSQSLHPDADRRLWLTPGDDAWGPPSSIRFCELWIQKPAGPQLETVLAVEFQGLAQDPPQPRWVAYDFPLARPLVLDNLRRLSAGAAKTNAKSKVSAPAVDVGQLLGEDLVDEYSRRLVDAVDR